MPSGCLVWLSSLFTCRLAVSSLHMSSGCLLSSHVVWLSCLAVSSLHMSSGCLLSSHVVWLPSVFICRLTVLSLALSAVFLLRTLQTEMSKTSFLLSYATLELYSTLNQTVLLLPSNPVANPFCFSSVAKSNLYSSVIKNMAQAMLTFVCLC